ncbi:hypothetical protein PVK06_048454 [Gossypium arboreum]|uniref:RING-H2 finger protein ATL63 n=1 Tax=Gossypium arboreum TaxID=29729 RepID=A0ABR0MGB3_GOSAR|nr:hypothetical protein PVK06_048454 [Gossypium arboreum]
MTRRNLSRQLLFDKEIDRTVRRNQREIRRSLRYMENEQENDTQPLIEEMAKNQGNRLPPASKVNQNLAPRTMYDYAKPSLTGTKSSIVRPTVAANTFELKPNTIQMIQQFVQFDGLQDEDPNAHLANFLELCDTFKINGVSDDAIRLRLFPFSLKNKAK